MEKLQKLLKQLQTYNDKLGFLNANTSVSSVGWHVHHSYLVVNGICTALATSNPLDYQYQFNKLKVLVFFLGKIPRGRGKAPERVQPKTEATPKDIIHLANTVQEKLDSITTLHQYSHFKHPLFGKLHKKDSLQFLVIHTKHHIKIIEDILKNTTK